MKWFAIVGMCIAAAVVYGVVHDQITARICIEYFTIGHPDIGSRSPTVIGLFWGVVATWWVGAGLGTLLAWAARMGPRPKVEPRELVRPLGVLLSITAGAAVVSGVVGWIAASRGFVVLIGELAKRVPRERQVAFLVDLWAHSASYLVGVVCGIVLVVWVWRRRGAMARTAATG